jgi:AcrR family transcriptional regulator
VPPEVRRQARGLRRIDQILEAAAGVFADAGYQAATTTAIAERAGISPGSLYQFFGDKDAIADALAARYAAELRRVNESTFRPDLVGASLDGLIDRVVNPFIEFNLTNPGFQALFTDPTTPARLSGTIAQLHELVTEQFEALLGARAPQLPADDRRRCAQVSVQLFRALLPVILTTVDPERSALVTELKRALRGYLASVLGG